LFTHSIPCGVFHGIRSIIGPGCVVDPVRLQEEIKSLVDGGVTVEGILFVAENAHIVQPKHVEAENAEARIGTTKRGIGPCYADKYARTGIRAKDVFPPEMLVNMYDELHNQPYDVNILFEGAQGFGLDIDHGDYPYVTSSHCGIGSVLLNGVPPESLNEIWGVAKIYETYVGAKNFEPDNPIFPKLREIGGEFGATTGRPRQCDWLNMARLRRAIRMNGITHLVLNKCDIIKELGVFRLYSGEDHNSVTEEEFNTFEEMKTCIEREVLLLPSIQQVHFSEAPEGL